MCMMKDSAGASHEASHHSEEFSTAKEFQDDDAKQQSDRIRTLIDNCITTGHRGMFVIVGNKGRDQVAILHQMLSRATVQSRPSVLWCYKKELGFSPTDCKKRIRQLQKKNRSGKLNVNEDNPFEQFIAATNITYCSYSETPNILGDTYGMLILQDFEDITPNLLACTIETVEGGGLVVILLLSMSALKQLLAIAEDVNVRYRPEAHQDVVCRFSERFILSLESCKQCLVVTDKLIISQGFSHTEAGMPKKSKEEPLSVSEQRLKAMKESHQQNTHPLEQLVNCCQTSDQETAILKCFGAMSEGTLSSTVTLTAARGRGKSAVLGLAIAGAVVAFDYDKIIVTSPRPEDVKTLFEFVRKGFDAMNYQERKDYELSPSTNQEFSKAPDRVDVFIRDHHHTIQYIHPTDAHKVGQPQLVVIDEAAAIPLPVIRNLLGPYVVFMASTNSGYEGTGSSLCSKLTEELRQWSSSFSGAHSRRELVEVTLNESVRYKANDAVERWLNQLLCLDATLFPLKSFTPPVAEKCELYYINKDVLFSYHKSSEMFLQRIMGVCVSSQYKNSPNDLQMMSDSHGHHLFCLLPPDDSLAVLCVVHVCLEGNIQKWDRRQRPSGDLIPWTVSQQYQHEEFARLSGARVVRIAPHPDYQKMGYDTRAIQLLQEYYERKFVRLDEEGDLEEKNFSLSVVNDDTLDLLLEESDRTSKNKLPPLLIELSDRQPEKLDYLGVCYGLTADRHEFWKKVGFVPVHLRLTPDELTGEHSCTMIKLLNEDDSKNTEWLVDFWAVFRRHFVSLLSGRFQNFKASLCLSVLDSKVKEKKEKELSKEGLQFHLTLHDLETLELYSENLVDYDLIVPLLPNLARLYFLKLLGATQLFTLQATILLSMGLQHKTVEEVSQELILPARQIHGLLTFAIQTITQYLKGIVRDAVEALPQGKEVELEPGAIPLDQELAQDKQKKKTRGRRRRSAQEP